MYSISEIKTTDELHKVFSLAADGETVTVSKPGVVVLSREQYKRLKNTDYDNRIEKAIKRVQAGEGVVFKTIEELETMEQ